MFGTIKITVYDPIAKEVSLREVEADIKDGLAIHESVDFPGFWTLTHIKSGFSCRHSETKRKVVRDRELFSKLNLNGIKFVDMEACEVLSLITLLYEKVKELENKPIDPDKEEALIKMAHRSADIIACARI